MKRPERVDGRAAAGAIGESEAGKTAAESGSANTIAAEHAEKQATDAAAAENQATDAAAAEKETTDAAAAEKQATDDDAAEKRAVDAAAAEKATTEKLSEARPMGHPFLQEIDSEQVTDLEKQFLFQWRHPDKPKSVQKIWGVHSSNVRSRQFKQYRQTIIKACCKADGNTRRRFHGTSRTCKIGDLGHNTLCTDAKCAVCCIMRDGFKLPVQPQRQQRFGHGFYTSATSSKACQYPLELGPHSERVLLVVKVVCGEPQFKSSGFTKEDMERTEAPDGFHCIVGEPSGNNLEAAAAEGALSPTTRSISLNFDELVVFDASALLPIALLVFSPTSTASN